MPRVKPPGPEKPTDRPSRAQGEEAAQPALRARGSRLPTSHVHAPNVPPPRNVRTCSGQVYPQRKALRDKKVNKK